VKNQGRIRESGILAPLSVGDWWDPVGEGVSLDLEAGGSGEFTLEYERRGREQEDSGPRNPSNAGRLCFPLLYSGLDETGLVEVEAVPGPVAVRWDFTPRISVEEQFPLRFTLQNPSKKPVRGSYELIYGRQRAKGNFLLDEKESKSFSAQCMLPDEGGGIRRRDPVTLKLSSGKISFSVHRGIEATQNLTLGEVIPLARRDKYGEDGSDGQADGGVTMRIQAGTESLTVEFDLGDRRLEEATKWPAAQLELWIDGRPAAECHRFGFVSPLRIAFGAVPGPGQVAPIAPAAFGNFYGKVLSEAGVHAVLGMRPEGIGKRIVVRIPRIYLYRHEWNLDSPKSSLGLNARLRLLRNNAADQTFDYPESREWIVSRSDLCRWNARGLPAVELGTDSSSRWTVRLD